MAKAKRKAMSQKLRFEVFKRDSFTCQYCGRKAPDVLLEVDHIHPVAEGGDNSIINLTTACKECNRGKGKRKLSDSSVVDKQQKQLEELQEKHNQLQMMIEWKEGLADILDEQVDYFSHKLYEISDYSFSVSYRKKIKDTIKKVGFCVLFDAFEICIDQYSDDDNEKFATTIVQKLIGVAVNLYTETKNPKQSSIRHIANMLKKNCNYFSFKTFYTKFPDEAYYKADEKEVLQFAMESNCMDRFFKKLGEYYGI